MRKWLHILTALGIGYQAYLAHEQHKQLVEVLNNVAEARKQRDPVGYGDVTVSFPATCTYTSDVTVNSEGKITPTGGSK